ncbi:DUF3025 domain-containing protein [Paucibacter sp. KBW04]|uniref:DUF3025 domain-containing protein n=1 Tax=Paucibacter sp. KBW04 TaxID=2153361 RepID=UPI0026CAFC43
MEAALSSADLAAAFEQTLGQPWLQAYRPQGQVLLEALRPSDSVAEALNQALALRAVPIVLAAGPLRFVPQELLPEGEAYERFVHRTASVPTRDNAHDLLNGLIWLLWPRLKARLNALHMSERGDLRGSTRGPLRDALTVLDENAAFLSAPQPLCEALRARDWQRLFIELRDDWQQAQLLPFGHALLEKLMLPRKPICAHVLILPTLDEASVCAALDDPEWLARKPFVPLPVLGVPGWWPANESADFYADPQVFRPPRL